MTTRTLRIHMTSDWRIGSGTGRQGSIDGLVVRDVNGLPYIPSTTLRGIWRDAAETLAHGLDNGKSGGPWSKVVSYLFGDQPALEGAQVLEAGPATSALCVDDARFPSIIGEHLKTNKKAARDAFTFVKSGVAIDPSTGTARHDFLKFDEIARAGAILETTVSVEPSAEPAFDSVTQAFALASLRLVERIGGDRRRGAGRCEIKVDPVSGIVGDVIDAAIATLEKTETAPNLPTARTVGGFSYGDIAFGADALRLSLDLQIVSPTNIARKVEGNVVTTHDHIPGTMLISSAKEICLKAGVREADFLPALASGRIRVLNAYPQCLGGRATPLPIVLEAKKDNNEGPFVGKGKRLGKTRKRLQEPSTEQYKALRAGYGLTSTNHHGLIIAQEVESVLRTQNAVDDQRQKPTEQAGGGVYVLDVLVPGSVLASEIIIDRGLLIQGNGLQDGETFTTRVGRARKAGFGRVEICVSKERKAAGRAAAADGYALLLASDLVLPAACIGASPIDQIGSLLKESGIEATIDEATSDLRFRRHDGWVSAWGLPRPTLTAISAGSVIGLKDVKHASAAAIETLAVIGLGLRCGEGFGEIIVNPAILANGAKLNPADGVTWEDDGEGRSGGTSIDRAQLSKAAEDYLTAIEATAVLEVLRTFVELAAADEKLRVEMLGWLIGGESPVPPMSQLGAIRGLIDLTKPDFGKAIAFLDKIRKVEKRWKKWGEGKRAIDALHNLLSEPQAVWTIIQKSRHNAAFEDALKQALILATLNEAKSKFAGKAASEFLYAAIRQHKRASEKKREG